MLIGLVKKHQTVKLGLVKDTTLSYKALSCLEMFCKRGTIEASRKGSWCRACKQFIRVCTVCLFLLFSYHENIGSHSVKLNVKSKMNERKRNNYHKLLLK